MGQLRTAARTLASLDLTPDEVLLQLNRMSQDLDATQIATCLYAVFDPINRNCAMARAGHVPPILLYPDGLTEVIDLPPGLPLGIGTDPFEMREITLPVGGVLALYTDGLVESRRRDIDEGIWELRNQLSVQLPSLDDVCEATVSAQRAGHERDDIALLLARVQNLGENEIAIWNTVANPEAVPHVRKLVRERLAEWDLECMADSTELIISELVTNAVNHGWAPIQVRLLRGRLLVCEVTDASPMMPMQRNAGEEDSNGRGLQLINWLAHRWGTRVTRSGKVVWVEQRLP
jgi:anti-sigma regulatory factor (Ser/Thr protein kinase)